MLGAAAAARPKPAMEAQVRRPAGQSPSFPAAAGRTFPTTMPGGAMGTYAGSVPMVTAAIRPARGPLQAQQQQQQQLHAASGPGVAGRGGMGGGVRADENNAVVVFLKEAGMEQYAVPLLQSGFDDLETLFAIEDSDMKDLGIPPYHVVRLRRRLQEVQRQGARGGGEHDPNHPVVLFLEEAGLGQYAKPILRSGFDDLDTLMDIEDSDMKDIGIPRGHALKLRKRLREYELGQYAHEDPYSAPIALHQQVLQVQTPQHRPVSMAANTHMIPEQMRSTVEQSWEHVLVVGTYAAGEILYRHTFEIMPDAIQLFPTHVRQKYREWSSDEANDESNVYESPALRKLFSKFINAVGCAVAGLHDNTKLVPMLTQLGARHINYGVNEAHFKALGKAFSLMLADILGAGFTQEVEAAWGMAYNFMSSIMMEGLRGAIAAREASLVKGRPQGEAASESAGSTGQASEDMLHLEPSGPEAGGATALIGEGAGL